MRRSAPAGRVVKLTVSAAPADAVGLMRDLLAGQVR